jgi:hypothetical protein
MYALRRGFFDDFFDDFFADAGRAGIYQAVIRHRGSTAVPTGCPGWRRTTPVGT